MACDEGVRRRIGAGGEQRRLAARFEVARKQDRRASFQCRPQHETSIVDRAAAVLVSRVEHGQPQPGAQDVVSPPQSSHRDAPRHGIGDEEARHRIAVGSRPHPQLADLDIPQHGAGSSRVVVVIVRQRQNVEPAASPLQQRGNDDAVAGVESPATRRPRIHEKAPAVRTAHRDGESLADVDDLDAAGAHSLRRPAEVERDHGQRHGERRCSSQALRARRVPQPRREQARHVRDDEHRSWRRDAQVAAGNRGSGA